MSYVTDDIKFTFELMFSVPVGVYVRSVYIGGSAFEWRLIISP